MIGRRDGRWPRRTVVLLALIITYGAYVTAWSFRRETGLIRPTANLRYYYFVDEPDSSADRVLYVVYWPMVRLSYAGQRLSSGQRYDIH